MTRTSCKLVAAFAVLLISACASGGLSTRDDDRAYFNASIGQVNHTDQYLYGFRVNGAYGANAPAYGGDIAGTCCVRLPRVYRPGLTVDITYDLLINNGKDDNWKTKTAVPVEPYSEPGDVYVHFFPNDRIRVVVSNPGPRSTLHPIPRPINPDWMRAEERQ